MEKDFVKFKIPKAEFNKIVESAEEYYWNSLKSNDYMGWRIVEKDENVKFIGEDQFVCIATDGDIGYFIDRDDFSKAISRFANKDFQSFFSIYNAFIDHERDTEIELDSFWKIFEYIKSEVISGNTPCVPLI